MRFVDTFLEFAALNPQLTFLVTEIACGLAGRNPCDMAPLLAAARQMENVHLPASFWKELESGLLGDSKHNQVSKQDRNRL